MRYTSCMIISFQHKGLEKFYYTGSTKGIQAIHVKKLQRILGMLNVATNLQDLNLPSFRLHPLKGDLDTFWSITVSANWRITFRFIGNDIELVNYVDYH